MLRAPINKIIRFSSVDGPGNRTAVFFQGCNFNCVYCHNPETISICRGCKKCIDVCRTGALSVVDGRVEYDESRCVLCDECIHICSHTSSPRIKYMSVDEVLDEILKNVPFIRGITVSGGECTLNRDFVTALFKRSSEYGLNCMIDSNGSYDFSADRELLDVTDAVMLDIKAYDRQQHIAVTGHDNDMVLKNADYLASEGKLFEIRTVAVLGLFDVEETVDKITRRLAIHNSNKSIRYKLIKYREMGVRTENRIYNTPDDMYMNSLRDIALNNGFEDIVII